MFKIRKLIAILICFCLLFEQSGFARFVPGSVQGVDLSGIISGVSNVFAPDKFRPIHLRYLSYNTAKNDFRLFLDKGDTKSLDKALLEGASNDLMRYFMVGLVLPNDYFWVNLRPDQENNIIDADLEKTDVGRIMLAADVQLKKDTAQFTSPNTPEGKEYWNRLYQKAAGLYGITPAEIPTTVRPWIVPDEIIIRESEESAYIYKATLKVILEQEYLKKVHGPQTTVNSGFVPNSNAGLEARGADERRATNGQRRTTRDEILNEYAAQLMRELIIPKLNQRINASKVYAPLRQIYYSLIMAQWFKSRFKGESGRYSALIDLKDLTGLTSKESWSKRTYFEEYKKSFHNGEYNIKEPAYTARGQGVIRTYVSGGVSVNLGKLPQGARVIVPGTGTDLTVFEGGDNAGLTAEEEPVIDFGADGSPRLERVGSAGNPHGAQAQSASTNKQPLPPQEIEEIIRTMNKNAVEAHIRLVVDWAQKNGITDPQAIRDKYRPFTAKAAVFAIGGIIDSLAQSKSVKWLKAMLERREKARRESLRSLLGGDLARLMVMLQSEKCPPAAIDRQKKLVIMRAGSISLKLMWQLHGILHDFGKMRVEQLPGVMGKVTDVNKMLSSLPGHGFFIDVGVADNRLVLIPSEILRRKNYSLPEGRGIEVWYLRRIRQDFLSTAGGMYIPALGCYYLYLDSMISQRDGILNVLNGGNVTLSEEAARRLSSGVVWDNIPENARTKKRLNPDDISPEEMRQILKEKVYPRIRQIAQLKEEAVRKDFSGKGGDDILAEIEFCNELHELKHYENHAHARKLSELENEVLSELTSLALGTATNFAIIRFLELSILRGSDFAQGGGVMSELCAELGIRIDYTPSNYSHYVDTLILMTREILKFGAPEIRTAARRAYERYAGQLNAGEIDEGIIRIALELNRSPEPSSEEDGRGRGYAFGRILKELVLSTLSWPLRKIEGMGANGIEKEADKEIQGRSFKLSSSPRTTESVYPKWPSISDSRIGDEMQANPIIMKAVLSIAASKGLITWIGGSRLLLRYERTFRTDLVDNIDLGDADGKFVFDIAGQRVIVVDAEYLSIVNRHKQYASAGLKRGVVYVTRNKFNEWQAGGILADKVLHIKYQLEYVRRKAKEMFPGVKENRAYQKMSVFMKTLANIETAQEIIEGAFNYADLMAAVNKWHTEHRLYKSDGQDWRDELFEGDAVTSYEGGPFDSLLQIDKSRDAHGLTKGVSPAEDVEFLRNLLENGVNKNKPIYTAPLAYNPGDAPRTSGSTCYRHGMFIVVSGRGKTIEEDGIAAVLVNPKVDHLIPLLEAVFPGVRFLSYYDVAQLSGINAHFPRFTLEQLSHSKGANNIGVDLTDPYIGAIDQPQNTGYPFDSDEKVRHAAGMINAGGDLSSARALLLEAIGGYERFIREHTVISEDPETGKPMDASPPDVRAAEDNKGQAGELLTLIGGKNDGGSSDSGVDTGSKSSPPVLEASVNTGESAGQYIDNQAGETFPLPWSSMSYFNPAPPEQIYMVMPWNYFPVITTLPDSTADIPWNFTDNKKNAADDDLILVFNNNGFVKRFDANGDINTNCLDFDKKAELVKVIYNGETYSFVEFREAAPELFKEEIAASAKLAFKGGYLYRAIDKTEWLEIRRSGYFTVRMQTNFERDIGRQLLYYAGNKDYAGIIIRIPVQGPYFTLAGLQVRRVTSVVPHFANPDILMSKPGEPEEWGSVEEYLKTKDIKKTDKDDGDSLGQSATGNSDILSDNSRPESGKINVSGESFSTSSEPISQKLDAPGGIDFRATPIVTRAITDLRADMGKVPAGSLNEFDLNAELGQIENMVRSDVIPYSGRIKELVRAACLKGASGERIRKFVSCISGILRIQEERAMHTPSLLRDILVVLESSRSEQELKNIFAR